MNVELLRTIQHEIVQASEKFRMDKWHCGSAMCIAGWACALNGRRFRRKHRFDSDYNRVARRRLTTKTLSVSADASVLLDLTYEQSNRLFHVGKWPMAFLGDYSSAAGLDERATVAAKRIDHFIATNGAE